MAEMEPVASAALEWAVWEAIHLAASSGGLVVRARILTEVTINLMKKQKMKNTCVQHSTISRTAISGKVSMSWNR